METVLVVRSAPRLAETAAAVAALGYRTLEWAVATPARLDFAVPAGIDGLIFTSGNGVFAYSDAFAGLPVWCVGAQTARVAAAAGWFVTGTGDADGLRMAALMAEREAPGRTWLHMCGAQAGEGWYATLEDAGHRVVRVVGYAMDYAQNLPEAVQAAFAEDEALRVLLMSPESARGLLRLLEQSSMEARNMPHVTAHVISPAVAAVIAGRFDTVVAATPDLPGVLATLPRRNKE